jgi:hypothetical protein
VKFRKPPKTHRCENMDCGVEIKYDKKFPGWFMEMTTHCSTCSSDHPYGGDNPVTAETHIYWCPYCGKELEK